MAPELFEGKYFKEKSDVWSIGIIFYRMLFGKFPSDEKNFENVINYFHNHEIIPPLGFFLL